MRQSKTELQTRRNETTAKVEQAMRVARQERIERESILIPVAGNSYVSQVGYRKGQIVFFQHVSPGDTRTYKDGESVSYYLVDGRWTPCSWFNFWDSSEYQPDEVFSTASTVDGGGQGRKYRVPRHCPEKLEPQVYKSI